MKTKEIPVLLLTGYLGSGKTTLLNRILGNEKGIRFAVIVNDIGEVNIDAALIQQGGVVGQKDDSLVALQNGCICCTLKMDLVQQLCDLARTNRFDYIVIEASGICEPAPIAQTICSIPTLGPQFVKDGVLRLDCIVTVVDALRMRDEFDNGDSLQREHIAEDDLENLVIQQIEFCNIILLNKASEVSADDLKRVRGIIRAIQPEAEIIPCDYGNVDLDRIVNTHLFDFDKVATSAAWIRELEGTADEPSHKEEHSHHGQDYEGGEVEEYGIHTFVYERRPAFNLGKFDEFVSGKDMKGVIRCKGICYFRDEMETCYVFEQAGQQITLRNAGQWYATMPKHELQKMLAQDQVLRDSWDEQYGDRMQKLVFIGQHIDRKAICEALDDCLEE